MFRSTTQFVDELVGQDSIWAVLHRESHRLFPDDAFADLFQTSGRRSIPPRILAVVMVLQKALGLSDREAVAAFQFDIRWKYACGGLDFDYPGFVHTVLSGMRARLASSDDPDRIFNATVDVAKAAGLIGRKRVMDSAPIYDAVATQDTVTLIRSAIRGLLKIVDPDLKAELQAVLQRDDDYTTAGKPVCDWEDPDARIELVDALASDGHGCLGVLDGRELKGPVSRAARLLATVVGQDLEIDADGRFVIARKVAKDRVISTVDPDARHGHKTSARGFDGYKGHIAEDPDSEIITNTTVTAGNVADGAVAEELLADILPTTTNNNSPDATDTGDAGDAGTDTGGDDDDDDDGGGVPVVYGDCAYGTGELQQVLEDAGVESKCRTQKPVGRKNRFSKAKFKIDLDADTVKCPNKVTVTIRRSNDGTTGTAAFGENCAECPLRKACTESVSGRTISVGPHEAILAKARERQNDPGWQDDYRSTRPKVERKLAHLLRRQHGGRRARMRGRIKVGADFALLAAAQNLARLGALGVTSTPTGWATAA
ncbi:MAG: transposase [Candidatus Microthrix parvicella]